MRIRGYKFGHPVFGYSDYFDFMPDFEIDIEIENDKVCIRNTVFDLGGNKPLYNLLAEGDASLIVEVFCSYTMYRKCFLLNPEFELEIPIENLKNRVECLFFIVSQQNFQYQNYSVQPTYKDIEFSIEKGDVLAFLGDYKFDIDLKGSTIDSFLKIREREDSNKALKYIFLEDSIIIEINKKDFERIKSFHMNPDYQRIMISSLLQPALIHACYKIADPADDAYEEKAWYRTLMLRWEQLKNTEGPPSFDDIPEFVEILLNNPTDSLLDVLEEMNNKVLPDDDF